MKTRGEWFRFLRDRAGLSQAQVGDVVGVDAATVGNWEAGRRGPGERLGALLTALHATDDERLSVLDAPRHADLDTSLADQFGNTP